MPTEMTIHESSIKPVPPGVKTWNWGAFFLNWIWGIRHGVWISFLVFIPFFNLIWIFILGAKGSEWAWQKGDWKSLEEFKKTQRRWSIAGFIVFFATIIFVSSLFFGVMSILKNSDPSIQSYQLVTQSSEIQNLVGTPIKRGYFTQGNINVQAGGSGDAALSYSISGPKAHARVYVTATKEAGKWRIIKLIVVDQNNKHYSLPAF
jgi:hypothetical protein